MDKLKRFLILPVVYHTGLLLGMVITMTLAQGKSDATWLFYFLVADLLLGGIVTPMYFAVMSMAHAIVHEAKVYDYIYKCLLYLVIIGVIRVGAYALAGGMGQLMINLGVAIVCFVVSVGVFTVWDCLFAFTDHMMKKRPGRKNK